MSALSLNLIVTKKADADETAIYNYISETFGNIYADNFRKKLIEVFRAYDKTAFYWKACKRK